METVAFILILITLSLTAANSRRGGSYSFNVGIRFFISYLYSAYFGSHWPTWSADGLLVVIL